MKRHLPRLIAVFALLLTFSLFIGGLTIFAAAAEPDILAPAIAPSMTAPIPTPTDRVPEELYPADVQTIISNSGRQIIRTYILTTEQRPSDISRSGFVRDNWRYTLTDITERKTSETVTKTHIETITINTDSKDLNDIIPQLFPTLEYKSEDGNGILTLDLASVQCEVAGYKDSSYTASAKREYPHLSSNDPSLIPKTITENGRTLTLADVKWETQNTINVDYDDIPDSYRAVAEYTASAYRTVATGYITTADYTGEITKTVSGDAVYTAYFSGSEIISVKPEPITAPESALEPEPEPELVVEQENTEHNSSNSYIPAMPLLIGIAVLAALIGGAIAFLFLRHNVKVYTIKNGVRTLTAKARISKKKPSIDLTELGNHSDIESFLIEIDKLTAKTMNGTFVEAVYGPTRLKHKIAYEGNAYKVEADFHAGTINAVY